MSMLFGQAVRLSHCDRRAKGDRSHACAGTMTISAAGISLDCPLCDSDKLEGSDAKRFTAVLGFDAIVDAMHEQYMAEFTAYLMGELGGDS